MKNSINFITAILMWMISYFYLDNLFIYYGLGFSITIFTVLIIALSYWYIRKNEISITKESYYYMAYVLMIGLSFSIFRGTGISFVKMLVLLTSLGYWLIVVTDSRTSKQLDQSILKDLLVKVLFIPISKLYLLSINLFPKVSIKDKKTINVLYGLVIAFPVLLIVISLLSNTDSTFNSIWSLFTSFKFLEELNLFMLVISFILASGFFSALYTNINKVDVSRNAIKPYLDNIVIKTVLICFVLLYLIYLMSVSYTYFNYQTVTSSASDISSYAKSGFYELCVVCFINFILFITSRWLSVEEDKIIKTLLCVIGAQTLVMISLAILRLFVYINVYGLTYLRVNALVFMLLLFITVTLFIIGLFKNINYAKISVLIGSFVFLIMCYINIGNLIVNYNYYYKNIEINYFTYGYESIPHLVNRYKESNNSSEKENIKLILEDAKTNLNETKYINHTIESLNYLNMLKDIK